MIAYGLGFKVFFFFKLGLSRAQNRKVLGRKGVLRDSLKCSLVLIEGCCPGMGHAKCTVQLSGVLVQ